MFRKCVCLILLTLILALTGCSTKEENMHEKIHAKFYDMPSYEAECILTVTSNKTKNQYPFTCYYNSTLDKYRIDYPDKSVILSKDSAEIISNSSISKVAVDNTHMLMFINTFFKNYYTGENASVKTIADDSSGYTVLDCEIRNADKFASKMQLHIKNNDVSPYLMTIYDNDGKETMNITFNNFKITNNTNKFN